MTFQEFLESWTTKSADILADLEYERNLAEHFVTLELFIMNVKESTQAAQWLGERDLTHWYLLSYEIYDLYNRMLKLIPDFSAKLVPQFRAMSRETIRQERLYSVTLQNPSVMGQNKFIREIKERDNIREAYITTDKTLIILLIQPQLNTIEMFATALGREVESKNIEIGRIIIYDADHTIVHNQVEGKPIFEKPLTY